jgi:hypothetical protein
MLPAHAWATPPWCSRAHTHMHIYEPAHIHKYIQYMNAACLCVTNSTPLSRAYRLFRTMGLRHLPVVDLENRVIGILSRASFSKDMLHRCALVLISLRLCVMLYTHTYIYIYIYMVCSCYGCWKQSHVYRVMCIENRVMCTESCVLKTESCVQSHVYPTAGKLSKDILHRHAYVNIYIWFGRVNT